jgi:hypothetical protein
VCWETRLLDMRVARLAGRLNHGGFCSQRSWGAVSDWNATVAVQAWRVSRAEDKAPGELRENSVEEECGKAWKEA